jgi:hypothetical protein
MNEWRPIDDPFDWECDVCSSSLAEVQGYFTPEGMGEANWNRLAEYFEPETFVICENCLGGFCGLAEFPALAWFTVRLPELVEQYGPRPRIQRAVKQAEIEAAQPDETGGGE